MPSPSTVDASDVDKLLEREGAKKLLVLLVKRAIVERETDQFWRIFEAKLLVLLVKSATVEAADERLFESAGAAQFEVLLVKRETVERADDQFWRILDAKLLVLLVKRASVEAADERLFERAGAIQFDVLLV